MSVFCYYILFLYGMCLLSLLVFLSVFIHYFVNKKTPCANRDNLVSSSLIKMTFISFSGLITLARNACTMLNRSGRSGCSHLVLKRNKKLLLKKFEISLSSTLSAGDCHRRPFHVSGYLSPVPTLFLNSFVMHVH